MHGSFRTPARRRLLAGLVCLLLAAFVVPALPVHASTYRRFVAQVPALPAAGDTVRVWIDSDTAFGESAGVEYGIGGVTYTRLLGTYDTGYPGANWYVDIPAQPEGTRVDYQLFTRSQSGADYGFGGFHWAYTSAGARALWIGRDTIAWNNPAAPATSYKLLHDPDGSVDLASAAATPCAGLPTVPCFLPLAANGAVDGADFPANPNANALTRLDLPPGTSDEVLRTLLRGEVVVASYDGSTLHNATRAQIQGVLDDLYARAAQAQALGPTYAGHVPTVRVWAPTARSVTLRRYADSTTADFTHHPMTLDSASGVWTVTGEPSWDRQFYLFDVEVYVPSAGAVVHNLVTDPYAASLSMDRVAPDDVRAQFVDLDDPLLKPSGWDTLPRPALAAPEDMAIYEVHVRDFSIGDPTVPEAHRAKFLAFTATASDGMTHLLALRDAGLTHVHLLPAFDVASVIENPADRIEPAIPTAARDSDLQQAAVAAARGADGFNWGYDPYHWGVPDGSYSTNPDGALRILEFRQMVAALHSGGLRVALDVVYNHTAAAGQDDKSVLDKIVPGYYYRYDAGGARYNSSCCADTASEYAMMEKLMVDTVVRWAAAYQVDAFRFDLMNLHTRRNMLAVQHAAWAVDPTIYIYGEGWDFGSAAAKGLAVCPDCYAQQYNMTGTGIGTFNDKLRDAAHGGYSTDPERIRRQGFINGLSYDWNGYCYAGRARSDLWAAMADLRTALAGSGLLYAGDPQETINYVEKHDNETLFDLGAFKLPAGDGAGQRGWCGSGIPFTSMADRVRAHNLGTSLVGLAQGIPFFQMGQDLLRSKSLDRNSYDSGDWFNRVDWTGAGNNFGVGLPPAWDNELRWPAMRPLLANTALDPAPADVEAAAAHLREVLRIRTSSPLLRLTSQAAVDGRIRFYDDGPAPHDALIVMKLSDEPAPDLDPDYETILVFFNANKVPQGYTIPGAVGLSFALHPVQADTVDADPALQAAAFDAATGEFVIPARTTALFVSAQLLDSLGDVDWVGLMWPRGGVAHQVDERAAAEDFDVYVQAYEPGVTDTAGQGAGIACTLQWGEYGRRWTELPMAYNGDVGNNDEYRATIPRDTLNALRPGSYGFNTWCSSGPERAITPKQDGENIAGVPADDDQGDGLITVVPALDPRPAPEGGVFVHLFEWRWADVEKECAYLADKGYGAVQVSPPQEHVLPVANQGGQPASDYPWWVRYQPVTHSTATLTSRSGTLAEFQSMVAACNNLGVDVYVDAVINHMADLEVGTPPRGTAGTEYNTEAGGRFYGDQYAGTDFNPDCDISDYADRSQVQHCTLSGLPDLNTGSGYVQAEIRAYLQSLLDLGVAGFRIDGAKHMPAHDVRAILADLAGPAGGVYVYQEVIDVDPRERVRDWEYTPAGDVAEFGYSTAVGARFSHCGGGKLADLETLSGYDNLMDSAFAVVFTDNHDNQRGHGPGGACVVDHRDGQLHVLANIFALAYPYGYPKITSSYYWSDDPASQAGDSKGPPSATSPYTAGSGPDTRPVYGDGQAAGDVPENCSATFEDGKWVCEHRRAPVANMVAFRQVTAGRPLTGWWDDGADHIAFGRGDRGFVAINRGASSATTTYRTAMRPGTYCDVVHYDLLPGSRRCVDPATGLNAPRTALVTVDDAGRISARTLNSMDAFAIHAGARVNVQPPYLPLILKWPEV